MDNPTRLDLELAFNALQEKSEAIQKTLAEDKMSLADWFAMNMKQQKAPTLE